MLEFLVFHVGLSISGKENDHAPLLSAVDSNRLENVKWFLQNGASIKDFTSELNPLHYAFICKDEHMFRTLLEAGAVVDAKALELSSKFSIDLHDLKGEN